MTTASQKPHHSGCSFLVDVTAEKCADDPVEGPEIRGLIGRAYKQLFVTTSDPEALKAAIVGYRPDWEHR
jgi:hypothetical protein